MINRFSLLSLWILSLFSVFELAKITPFSQNYLVILKMLFILASCKKRRLQCVGSNTTDFRIRFRNHKSAMITNKKTCKVAVHFNKNSHTLSDFSFQCIDQVQASSDSDHQGGLLECSFIFFGTPAILFE